jgi:hypothetical protein
VTMSLSYFSIVLWFALFYLMIARPT